MEQAFPQEHVDPACMSIFPMSTVCVCVCVPCPSLTPSSLLPPQKELFSGAAAKGGAVEGVQEGGPRRVMHRKAHQVGKLTD